MDEGNSRVQEAVAVTSVAADEPFWHSKTFAALLIFILCAFAYWNSLDGRFQYDDHHVIRFNLEFRESNWDKILLYVPGRPLGSLTFALNYKMFGMNPIPYHLTNVLLHSIAVILFFLLLLRMNSAQWFALIAAGLMAVHPLNTESVSYITSRFIVLCAVFYLASFLFLDSYVRKQSRNSLVGFIVCFVLAAISKENFVAIPITAALYIFLIHGKEALARNKLILLSLFALTIGGALYRIFGVLTVIEAPPVSVYWPTEINVWVRYIWLAIYPVSLNVEHDVPALTFTSPWFLGSLLILIAICALLWILRKRHPILSFWGLWFFINLLPSSIIPLNEFMSEHSTYISLFGFCACFSYLLMILGKPYAKPAALVWVVVLVVISLYTIGTIHRNRMWHDPLSLWTDAIEKSPKRVRPRLNMANVYIDQKAYEKAIQEYSLALSYAPRSKEALTGIGIAYLRMGAVYWAEGYFRKALAIDPNAIDAKVGLGLMMYENREYRFALDNLEPIYHTRWSSPEVVRVMADCYIVTGKNKDAIRVLKRCIDSGEATSNLYPALMESYFIDKNPKEALAVFDRYKNKFPQSPITQLRVAEMLQELGRNEQARILLIQVTNDPKYGKPAFQMLKKLEAKMKQK